MDSLGGLMNISGQRLTDLGDPSVAKRQSLDEQASFSAVLSRVHARPGEAPLSPREKAREAAQQLVATALVQPMLKQLRETNNAAEPFKPNAAEKSFGRLMDTELSQRIVSSRGWALVDRVADSLLAKGGQSSEVKA